MDGDALGQHDRDRSRRREKTKKEKKARKKEKKEKKLLKKQRRDSQRREEEKGARDSAVPAAGVDALSACLDRHPKLAGDLAAIMDRLDDGETVDLHGLDSAPLREELAAVFQALGLRRAGPFEFCFEAAAAARCFRRASRGDAEVALAARHLPAAPLLTLLASRIDGSGLLDAPRLLAERLQAARAALGALLEAFGVLRLELPAMLREILDGQSVDTSALENAALRRGLDRLLSACGLEDAGDGFALGDHGAALDVAARVLQRLLEEDLGERDVDQAGVPAGDTAAAPPPEPEPRAPGPPPPIGPAMPPPRGPPPAGAEDGGAAFIGPALPGAAAGGGDTHAGTEARPRRTAGPEKYPGGGSTEIGTRSDGEEEDDLEGPSLNPNARAAAAPAAAAGAAFRPAARAAAPGGREEWMLVAPGDSEALGWSAGTRNRKFEQHRSGGRATAAGLRAQAQVREPVGEEERRQLEALEGSRGPSLMEEHRRRLESGKAPKRSRGEWEAPFSRSDGRRAFDHEEPMSSVWTEQRKKLSKSQVEKVVNDAQQLKQRFQGPRLL